MTIDEKIDKILMLYFWDEISRGLASERIKSLINQAVISNTVNENPLAQEVFKYTVKDLKPPELNSVSFQRGYECCKKEMLEKIIEAEKEVYVQS